MLICELDIVEKPATILPGWHRVAKSRQATVFKNERIDIWTGGDIPLSVVRDHGRT
jgi:hypothetical protein